MKVRLTIDLDLPEAEYSEVTLELMQNVFDAYTNYVTCSHLQDALRWCVRGKVGSDSEDPAAKRIYEYHNLWADISANAKWDLEELL